MSCSALAKHFIRQSSLPKILRFHNNDLGHQLKRTLSNSSFSINHPNNLDAIRGGERRRRPSQIYPGGEDAMEQSTRIKRDPSTTSVILFPGQGTQYVGMAGRPKSHSPYVAHMYEVASDILGYDLIDLCNNGPIEKLSQTVFCQPAILVSSLAALEKLRDEDNEAIESCVCTAGFSVGEITALVFANVISMEDGIRLVKGRAEAMQIASDIVPGAMATILYGADSKLNYSLTVAKEWCKRQFNMENPVCSIANYLFPHCKVIGGHTKAIEFLESNYKDFNLRRVKRLPVSGAFHTDLMRPAAETMSQLLNEIEIRPPKMPVFSNATGRRYHTSAELFRMLPKQIYRPVLWEQAIQAIYQRPKDTPFPTSFEVGPGHSLSTVLKLVNAKAHEKCKPVSI